MERIMSVFSGEMDDWSCWFHYTIIMTSSLLIVFFVIFKWRGIFSPRSKSSIVVIPEVLKADYVVGDDGAGLSHFTFLGLDCEMVGIGRGGKINILARCSIVTIKDDEIRVVYDKVVKPKGSQQITDYRTKYSGITKEMVESSTAIPFDQCKREVGDIICSYEGKQCIIVGHALKNDWDVLEIKHPRHMVRDTACYKGFTRSGRRAQKLRHLVLEHLDMSIQTSASGHCSVEDAASVLLLYKKFQNSWERSLRHPLKKLDQIEEKKIIKAAKKRSIREPIRFYLDSCNLPLGLRNTDDNWQLVSKRVTRDGGMDKVQHYDWIPCFKYLLNKSCPPIERVDFMFDGAKYKHSEKVKPGTVREIQSNVFISVTNDGEEADTRLVTICKDESISILQNKTEETKVISIDEAIALLEDVAVDVIDHRTGVTDDSKNDEFDYYIVVRRIAGGSKIQKNLFNKLNLRRPREGALCLTGLTARVLRRSLMIAKDLKRARTHHLVQLELHQRSALKTVVFTDDVLLADRITKEGGIVLSYWQMQDLDY